MPSTKVLVFATFCGFLAFTSCLKIDSIEESGISYSTIASEKPNNIEWSQIGLAKELINANKKIVLVSGGSNPVDIKDWNDFMARFPWKKNIDRNLLFDSTFFQRSPGLPIDCANCYTEIEYKKQTWIELARIGGVAFVPDKTDIIAPEEGHVVIKTIEKCQVLKYNQGSEVFELTDNKGNFYIMHATENGRPTLDVELPDAWTISTRILEEDFILGPFGGGDFCYFNILGDHLGQGFHQYIYADDHYP